MSFFRSTKPTNRPQHNFDSERAQNIAAQAMRHIMNEEEDSTSSGATHQPAKPKPVVPDFDDLLPGFEPVDGYTPKSKTFFSPSNGQTDLTGNPSVREPQGEMFADEDDEDENNVFIPKTNSHKEDTDDMAMSNMAVLSESTEIKGDINVKGDMRICGVVRGMVVSDGDIIVSGGEVDGDVKAKNITLEAGSVVKGNLHASGIAKLNGTVDGNVTAHDLKLCNGSILKSATIKAGTLSSEGNVTIESKALRIGAENGNKRTITWTAVPCSGVKNQNEFEAVPAIDNKALDFVSLAYAGYEVGRKAMVNGLLDEGETEDELRDAGVTPDEQAEALAGKQ